MPEEEKSHDTPILLELRCSRSEPAAVEVHVRTRHGWTVGRQLQEAFQDAGVSTTFMGYAADVTHTAITAVSALGGAAGIAAGLKVFFDRNQHRQVTVKEGDSEVSVKGFSLSDTERLLNQFLDEPGDSVHNQADSS